MGPQLCTYFITANCAGKRTLFQVERNGSLLFETLQHYREHYQLHAFVVRPDHMHLLLTPSDITLERSMQLVKGGFSHRYHKAGGLKDVWQTGYADHRCRNRDDFVQHKRYIEENPVRAGLCSTPEDYLWSSATRVLQERHPFSG